MKAKLEFNLPEEEDDFRLALNGCNYSIVIEEILNQLRSDIKYNEKLSEEVKDYAEKMRTFIHDSLIENGIRHE